MNYRVRIKGFDSPLWEIIACKNLFIIGFNLTYLVEILQFFFKSTEGVVDVGLISQF